MTKKVAKYDEDLCAHCFDVLRCHLSGEVKPDFPERYDPKQQTGGIFVTWNTLRSDDDRDGVLRGCIGYLDQIQLGSLEEYALRSSLHDSRFSPVSITELPSLSCQVSVLHSYEEREDRYDWEVGKHGIIIDFKDPRSGRHFNATYLPEVPQEHHMTKAVAIKELCKKAGYYGDIDAVKKMKLTRYQSARVSLTHRDYERQHRRRDVETSTTATLKSQASLSTNDTEWSGSSQQPPSKGVFCNVFSTNWFNCSNKGSSQNRNNWNNGWNANNWPPDEESSSNGWWQSSSGKYNTQW